MNPTDPLVRIYRSPALGWARPLWRLGKRGYHAARNRVFGGVRYQCGPVPVRVPSEYAWLWAAEDRYPEPEAMARVADWCRSHPDGVFLDIGCSIGRYSQLALTASGRGTVIAFDADLPSLHVTRRVCRAVGGRFRAVYGFVTDAGPGRSLDAAVRETAAAFERFTDPHPSGADTDYARLDAPASGGVPANTLDDLFRDAPPTAPVLVKIDIEGAEGLALKGGDRFLAEVRPYLLVSVHPTFLPQFGTTAAAVIESLTARGYAAEQLSVGHEEHWWCVPS